MTLVFDGRITRGDFSLDVSFSVDNEVLGITGPNGVGKTSILRVIAGLAGLSGGSLVLDGTMLDSPELDVFVKPEHRHVGMVFQDHTLLPFLSAEENVVFALRARGVAAREAREYAAHRLEAAGIGQYRKLHPHQLSGGQSQRVCLVRALAGDPSVVLLDEPLSALDESARPLVRTHVRSALQQLNGPKIVVSHDPADIEALCDRVIAL
jgi:molybdate transport system ATP-binding protein